MAEDHQGLSLREGMGAAGISYEQLWLDQLAIGGVATALEVEAYVRGILKPDAYQHNLLAQAINEHFVERGGDHPVGYVEQ
jgi:hypothetical protein